MRILIVFYSRYGNTAQLAEAVAEGALAIDEKADVVIKRIADSAPADVIANDPRWQQTAEALSRRYEEARLEDLPEADAIIFGTPIRYGMMSAELKLFIDMTGPLWLNQVLVDKVGAIFVSSGARLGGKEAAMLTSMIPFLHFGMIVVGVPAGVEENAELGSYYGASSTSGLLASDPPTHNDIATARALGARVATVTSELLAGRERKAKGKKAA